MKRRIAILHRRSGITYRSHLQGSNRRLLDPWRWDR